MPPLSTWVPPFCEVPGNWCGLLAAHACVGNVCILMILGLVHALARRSVRRHAAACIGTLRCAMGVNKALRSVLYWCDYRCFS